MALSSAGPSNQYLSRIILYSNLTTGLTTE